MAQFMSKADLHAMPILVVDDDPLQVSLTTCVLNDLGFKNIDSAANGKIALDKILHTKAVPDLVICDLKMPGMNGLELMANLRTNGFNGSLIILSGQETNIRYSASLVAQLSAFNFLGELAKPINKNLLESMISKLV